MTTRQISSVLSVFRIGRIGSTGGCSRTDRWNFLLKRKKIRRDIWPATERFGKFIAGNGCGTCPATGYGITINRPQLNRVVFFDRLQVGGIWSDWTNWKKSRRRSGSRKFEKPVRGREILIKSGPNGIFVPGAAGGANGFFIPGDTGEGLVVQKSVVSDKNVPVRTAPVENEQILHNFIPDKFAVPQPPFLFVFVV